jgi:hypothetical protein
MTVELTPEEYITIKLSLQDTVMRYKMNRIEFVGMEGYDPLVFDRLIQRTENALKKFDK